eukprot:TRINITY_DN4066_c0_g1_i7.p1 TRINITY_DN4066_c0_g1~~TRINITY_DN4066_c0_g1_i7.p1  ORF type:complete len:126 (+),score=9.49 TRINITY_DN4066_c0_g1_i7:263-640(+)
MLLMWEETKTTVRVTGRVEKMSSEESDILFHQCGTPEKAYYISCSQGKDHPYTQSTIYESEQDFRMYRTHLRVQCESPRYKWLRPVSWGGFRLQPSSLEILSIEQKKRILYKFEEGEWRCTNLSL